MPVYIVNSLRKSGLSSSNLCCNDNSLDRNSALFFSNLANKLLDMSRSIEAKMEELRKKVCEQPTGRGFLFASIEAPSMVVGVRMEYVEYIKRFGPPVKGKFDENLLNELRVELGIPLTNGI
jgi:hypothetical protein